MCYKYLLEISKLHVVLVTSQKVRVRDEKVLDISNYVCYMHNA